MVEVEYLKEGSRTEFSTGLIYDDGTPYSYREGKRQSELFPKIL